ncbi:protein AMBP-like isoform X1 [Seriola dumerili]|uniref:protein AMBP-like isoform X1 n=1 Tax=Seriola dumerili TaxID=41447 RepID=UPI000BBE4E48|nr:protein AMBP-like isoform X1 [Seriola dumerili]
MQRAVILVSVLVLGSAWTLQGAHVLPESLTLTQENFNLSQFMGQWYELAVVSTCPHYMKRKRGNPVIVALELQHVASESNFTMTATSFRLCFDQHSRTILPPYCQSATQHIGNTFLSTGFGADVHTYVVHSNYDEYAMMLLLSTEKPSGNETTTAKLYSRTMDVTPAVMDNYKTLVRQLGMTDGAIIMNQNKGECVPGDPETEPTTQPQISVAKRLKRKVVPAVNSGNF